MRCSYWIPMKEADALDVLELPSSATDREIRDASRHLTFNYHPDKNRGANAAHLEKLIDNFRQIQEALCVQQRLVYSVGDKPTREKVGAL